MLYNYELAKKLPKNGDLPELTERNFNVRAVERGSKIVMIDAWPAVKTVLQMPRGNLEGIYPRIFILKKAIMDIENKNYIDAFLELRKHRCDLNLIYDVNPKQFLSNLKEFIAQVNQVDWLNLFINSMQESERCQELDFMRPLTNEEVIKLEHQSYMLSLD